MSSANGLFRVRGQNRDTDQRIVVPGEFASYDAALDVAEDHDRRFPSDFYWVCRPMPLAVGQRVRPSRYVVEAKRQRAIKYVSGAPQRTALDAAAAFERDKRGTITADLTKDPDDIMTQWAVRVQWDDGTVSDTLIGRLESSDSEF